MTYRLFWMTEMDNFGDLLSPVIFDHFGLDYEFSADHEVLCVGSVITLAKEGTVVLGSGTGYMDRQIHPGADFRFVRGPLTRQRILQDGGSCPEIYGDPAMLLPEICEPETKQHALGIVPHYVDLETVRSRYPTHNIIDVVNKDPLEVARQISRCDRIVSSSLHGLICAHAYGIPAAWARFGGRIKTDGTKFRDHYLCAGMEPVCSTVEHPVYQLVQFDTGPMRQVFLSL